MIQLAEAVSGTLRAVKAQIFAGSNDISQKSYDCNFTYLHGNTSSHCLLESILSGI